TKLAKTKPSSFQPNISPSEASTSVDASELPAVPGRTVPSLPSRFSEKDFESLLSDAEKNFGRGSLMRLEGQITAPLEVVETGSVALDRALGIGGYPKGRIIEIFGPESSGKTTLTLHAIANVQKRGG